MLILSATLAVAMFSPTYVADDCQGATFVAAAAVGSTAPDDLDIRRVWAHFLVSQKKGAVEKTKEARLAVRIEELSPVFKELQDTKDDDRRTELSSRVLALIEEIKADLGLEAKAAPPVTPSPAASQLAKITALLDALPRRHDPRRLAQLIEELREAVAAANDRPEAPPKEAGFHVIFESSRAQTAAREDPSNKCSALPSKVTDFRKYFAEMSDLYDAAGAPAPPEVKDALSTLGMRPRIVAQLLPSIVLDGRASAVQASGQIQWRTRYLKVGGLEWNTDGGFGYGPTVVVLDAKAAEKITQQETTTSTIDASGQRQVTRTVTSTGSFNCNISTRQVDGVAKEVCDAIAAGAPSLGLQNAFMWHLGLQVGGGIEAGGRAGEIRLFGKAQMTNPTAEFKIAEDKSTKNSGSTALASIDGAAQWAFESGVRIAIYDRDRLEARERSGLRPALSVAYGFRWDKRLADTGIERAGKFSERRQFLRVALTKVPVFQDNGEFFNLTLGIDREWASPFGRDQNGLAGVTRLFLQANIDVLKVFGKQ
ncbi:MAG: hypothetical protein K1Y01_16735 [Vicinamibacteria bacterium]|nr:hypothetical protein [Vicinamibacteria bacterium]